MPARRPSRRTLVIGTAIVLTLGLAYGIYDAGNDNAVPPSNSATAITGGEAVGHRYKTRSWSLRYDTLRASNDNTFIEAIGVHDATIYRKNAPPISASADRATINLATKDFDVEGHVRVTSKFGGTDRVFETTAATWSESLAKLSLPGKIEVSGRGKTLTINGINFDAHTGKVQIGKIDGYVQP